MGTPLTYEIRLAAPADIPTISRLFLDSLDTSVPGFTFSNKPGYELPEIEAHLRKRLLPEDDSETTFVALHPETGELVGYVNVKRGKPLDSGCQMATDVRLPDEPPELDHLFTKVPKEGGSGKGVGSALMKRVLEEKRWTKEGIRLLCFEKNLRALEFYRRWGFVQVGRREGFDLGSGGDTETALILWLKASQ